MPLIIVTGLPSSGKTYRAQQIYTDHRSRVDGAGATLLTSSSSNLSIQYLPSFHASNDSSATSCSTVDPPSPSNNPRDLIFNTAREEKTARGEEISAIKRALTKNNIVIADSPNYIKGFRYQLWCEAKAVGTRCVVVHVAAREDECEIWNEARIKAWGWEELLQNESQVSDIKDGSKVGKDVLGSLQPESHTAIYGDRVSDQTIHRDTRSRSSSMGEIREDEGTDQKRDITDAMTLKSLYISEGKPDETRNGTTHGSGPIQLTDNDNQIHQTAALSSPPPPRSSLPYSPATLRSLSMRYEPPSPFTRWDTPLFVVPSTDTHPPYQAIWEALFPPPIKPTKKSLSQLPSGAQATMKPDEVRQHAATVLPKATSANALQVLESATADAVKALLSQVRKRGVAEGGEGGSLSFSVPDPKAGTDITVTVEIPPNTMLSQPALQRLRRKYTQMQRGGIAHGRGHVNGRADTVVDFARFLETEWAAE